MRFNPATCFGIGNRMGGAATGSIKVMEIRLIAALSAPLISLSMIGAAMHLCVWIKRQEGSFKNN